MQRGKKVWLSHYLKKKSPQGVHPSWQRASYGRNSHIMVLCLIGEMESNFLTPGLLPGCEFNLAFNYYSIFYGDIQGKSQSQCWKWGFSMLEKKREWRGLQLLLWIINHSTELLGWMWKKNPTKNPTALKKWLQIKVWCQCANMTEMVFLFQSGKTSDKKETGSVCNGPCQQQWYSVVIYFFRLTSPAHTETATLS